MATVRDNLSIARKCFDDLTPDQKVLFQQELPKIREHHAAIERAHALWNANQTREGETGALERARAGRASAEGALTVATKARVDHLAALNEAHPGLIDQNFRNAITSQGLLDAERTKLFDAYLAGATGRPPVSPVEPLKPASTGKAAEELKEAAQESKAAAKGEWVSKLFRNAEGKIHGGKVAGWVAGAAAVGTAVYAMTQREKEEELRAESGSVENSR